MAMNPIVFTQFESEIDFTPFATELSEFNWKNQICGLTSSGFLYVDEKVPGIGHYTFFPKLLPWKEIVEVRIKKMMSLKGIVFGIFLLFMAVCFISAGWIKRTHVGPGIYTIPIVGTLGGMILIFGAVRNSVRVEANGGTYKWMSGPLKYKSTIPLCVAIVSHCRKQQIDCKSHLDDLESLT